MATNLSGRNPYTSSDQDDTFLEKAVQRMPPLDGKEPIYVYTLFAVVLVILVQITLRLRQRIRTLETEARVFKNTREQLKKEIEALREEMETWREVDTEEKLCLIETVKLALRQGNGNQRDDESMNDVYSGSEAQDTSTVDDEDDIDCADCQRNDGDGMPVEEDTACPWCSHAHMLKLGGCTGDDTCDRSIHVPYCPSCFYREGKAHGQEPFDLVTIFEDGEPAFAVGATDEPAVTGSLEN